MSWISQIAFAALLTIGIGFFVKNIQKLTRNIKLGKAINRTDNPKERWLTMLRVAFGQSKMTTRPIAALLHFVVYAGFLIINLEVLEIIIDGLFGTHRVFGFMGGFYDFLIGSFEVLAVLVILAVIVFWTRRNLLKIQRFWKPEMVGFPKKDADYILYIEVVLMLAFLCMNGADYYMAQAKGQELAGSFPVSSVLFGFMQNWDTQTLFYTERIAWWLHIAGILFFLNYLYYSKHLHILLAFPNTYFSNLQAKGRFTNLESVTQEVKKMMDPNIDPFAADPEATEPETFGAKDIFDLNQMQLLNAYTCTECGRCTSECPANITGKKLSPRKIMMDTRDRLEEVGSNLNENNGVFKQDNKQLLSEEYISAEELWACTSCNACTEACPINIDPLSIIVDLRRYLVMEQSAAPQELNLMMTNVENNSAPWQFSQQDRLNWAKED